LFYSSLLQYYSDGPDREAMEWLCRQLATHCVARLTHLTRGMWAHVVGGLPSGAYCTSHAGSWIVLFLYSLFISCVIFDLYNQGEEGIASDIERSIADAESWIITYGDDHVVHSPKRLENLIGEKAFARWSGDVWNMQIRDVRQNVPFLSEVRGGELSVPGIVFLKNYFIKNPHKNLARPPKIVNFRPKSEMVIKTVIGRNGTFRTVPDAIMSTVGTVYTSMGNNWHLYVWLRNYHSVLTLFMAGGLKNKIFRDLTAKYDIRKYRQFGLTPELLQQELPSYDVLVQMNNVDPGYHTWNRDVHEDLQFDD